VIENDVGVLGISLGEVVSAPLPSSSPC